MPERDPQDSRRDQEQLRKSERAWLTYMHEDCALQGGMQGGSNAWVSTFAGLCEEKELKNRIDFLKSIADGPMEDEQGPSHSCAEHPEQALGSELESVFFYGFPDDLLLLLLPNSPRRRGEARARRLPPNLRFCNLR